MFYEPILLTIQLLTALITTITALLIYKTIKSNERLNQRILFGNITKEERELKIKLQEYNEKIDNKRIIKKEKQSLIYSYETLLCQGT